MTQLIQEPTILTANTYFWKSGSYAAIRRNNEERKLSTVESFFKEIGMGVERNSNNIIGKKDDILAEFSYSESCRNVYKHLRIYKNNKKSNIKTLRKLYIN